MNELSLTESIIEKAGKEAVNAVRLAMLSFHPDVAFTPSWILCAKNIL